MAAKGKRTVESVEIRPAKHPDGAYVTRTSFKTSRGGQGGGPSHDYASEEGAHEDLGSVHEHIDKMFEVESGTDKGAKYDKEDRGGPEKKEEI